MANKQDLPDSVSSEQLLIDLEIDTINPDQILVISVSALTGQNLMKALDRLASHGK